jgi:adenylate cyclase
MLNMVYPPFAIVGSFLGVNIYNIAAERSEKNEITKTFGRYVSPPVVDKILTALGKDELRLGGEQCEVTVAFADVRDFTSMSENIQAEELVRALNIYLSIVIREVQKHDGIINKFGGDSIMAVWNVPTPCKEHALRATIAAIQAQRAIKELQQSDANLLKMDFRIGINTGVAVAGNLGSQDRLEYSVIGDTVNVASRLTTLADSGRVWIGSSTYELVKEHVMVKQLEPLIAKGKREAIKAYEVVDMSIERVN